MPPVREVLPGVSVAQAATDKAIKPTAPIAIARFICVRIGTARPHLRAVGILMDLHIRAFSDSVRSRKPGPHRLRSEVHDDVPGGDDRGALGGSDSRVEIAIERRRIERVVDRQFRTNLDLR